MERSPNAGFGSCLWVMSYKKEGIAVPKTLSIGCMVEVPAFVLMCDEMECDFLSIGTNDLAQYTLAIDRTNPVTSNRYGEAHPSVLRMIKHVLSVAKVPVSLCGEMAANPKYTQMLLEMGVRTFSCAPRSIAPLKAKIRSISLDSV